MLGGGSGGIENFDKNSAIWCNLGIPKYVITILKINNLKMTNKDVLATLKLFD